MNDTATRRRIAAWTEATKNEPEFSPLLRAAINGNSDTFIVRETVKRLNEEMKQKGTDTFAVADLRRIRHEIFVT